jgi:hypothetical protein
MRKAKDEDELVKLRNTLGDAFERFKVSSSAHHLMSILSRCHRQVESQIRMENALDTVLTNTTTILTTTNTFHRNAVIGASFFYMSVDAKISHCLEEKLKTLKPVSTARFTSSGSPGGCLENTREDILDTMLSWASGASSSSSSMSVFWLAGLAGTGKSTIMKTLCQRIDHDGRFLLASFFASRNSAERRDPYAILRTFAYELATMSDLICPHVLSCLHAPRDIMQEGMHEQVEQLLAGPIREAQLLGRTIVLLIDALDECQKGAGGVEGGPLVELLAQSLQHLPVKLIVASRQEHTLSNMFRSLGSVSLHLHEIGLAMVEADVRRVLNGGFADIRRTRALSLETGEWPSQSQLDRLVHLTGPFFIYATTVLKFVGAPRFLPEQQLSQVLERGSAISPDSSQPFLQIDKLYMNVLQSATVDDESNASRTNATLCRRVGNLLRTLVLLEEPVSIRTLAHLMGVSSNVQEVDNDVRALGSVLLISPASGSERVSETVSTFHPSFRDFLVNPQRCSDEHFLVEAAAHQHKLFYQCVQVLNKDLCYDICGIRKLGLANADVQDLVERLASSVSEPLRYACRFWPVHMVASSPLTEPVSAALLEFCTKHLLHWFEVLSLCDDLSSAAKHLPQITVWFQVSILTIS